MQPESNSCSKIICRDVGSHTFLLKIKHENTSAEITDLDTAAVFANAESVVGKECFFVRWC